MITHNHFPQTTHFVMLIIYNPIIIITIIKIKILILSSWLPEEGLQMAAAVSFHPPQTSPYTQQHHHHHHYHHHQHYNHHHHHHHHHQYHHYSPQNHHHHHQREMIITNKSKFFCQNWVWSICEDYAAPAQLLSRIKLSSRGNFLFWATDPFQVQQHLSTKTAPAWWRWWWWWWWWWWL